MVAEYLVFAQNMPKQCIKVLYKIDILIRSEIVCQTLGTNSKVVFQTL